MTTPCQRWRERRTSYRPAGEPIDPKRFGVELVDERAWLDEVLAAPPFRALRHPGNHTYVWPLDGRRDTAAGLAPKAGPYPKYVEAMP